MAKELTRPYFDKLSWVWKHKWFVEVRNVGKGNYELYVVTPNSEKRIENKQTGGYTWKRKDKKNDDLWDKMYELYNQIYEHLKSKENAKR